MVYIRRFNIKLLVDSSVPQLRFTSVRDIVRDNRDPTKNSVTLEGDATNGLPTYRKWSNEELVEYQRKFTVMRGEKAVHPGLLELLFRIFSRYGIQFTYEPVEGPYGDLHFVFDLTDAQSDGDPFWSDLTRDLTAALQVGEIRWLPLLDS